MDVPAITGPPEAAPTVLHNHKDKHVSKNPHSTLDHLLSFNSRFAKHATGYVA